MSNRAEPGLFRRLLGLGPRTERAVNAGPVAVGFASSRAEAELMAGYLRNNGVQAIVSADDDGGLYPVLQAGQRVRVLVPSELSARARKLIDERE